MRLFILPIVSLLAACSSGSEGIGEPTESSDLTGLYLGDGAGAENNRVCMIRDPEGSVRFGIVTLAADRSACSGLGTATKTGENVVLTMSGEGDCAIPATLSDGELEFPDSLPEGCAYYCGPDASLAKASFQKIGATREAAGQATDLVGDPLCSVPEAATIIEEE